MTLPFVHLFPIFLDWLQIFAFTEPLILYLGGLCLGKGKTTPNQRSSAVSIIGR